MFQFYPPESNIVYLVLQFISKRACWPNSRVFHNVRLLLKVCHLVASYEVLPSLIQVVARDRVALVQICLPFGSRCWPYTGTSNPVLPT